MNTEAEVKSIFSHDHPPDYIQPGFFRRHWFWLVPLVALILVAPFFIIRGLVDIDLMEEPVEIMMIVLNENAQVGEKIGHPVTRVESTPVRGEFSVSGFEEYADFEPFQVQGPKGIATITGRMRKRTRRLEWLPYKIKVVYIDGTTQDIPKRN